MNDMGYNFERDGSPVFDQDFDRGFVQMRCDKRLEGCAYGLPHYHCKICGRQVNDDELRRDYHPCCSVECVKIYNKRFE